jgi:hypothetical protein
VLFAVSVHLIPSDEIKIAVLTPGNLTAPPTHIVPFQARAFIPVESLVLVVIHLIPSKEYMSGPEPPNPAIHIVPFDANETQFVPSTG